MNSPSQRPTRRGPNFFLLFVMAMMAFFLYTQYQRSRQSQAVDIDITIPDISNDKPHWATPSGDGKESPWPTPNSGESTNDNPHTKPVNSDWSIDTNLPTETDSRNQEQISLDSSRNRDTVESGDWSMQEGRSHSDKPRPKSSAPKKTNEGDWSLEEIPKLTP